MFFSDYKQQMSTNLMWMQACMLVQKDVLGSQCSSTLSTLVHIAEERVQIGGEDSFQTLLVGWASLQLRSVVYTAHGVTNNCCTTGLYCYDCDLDSTVVIVIFYWLNDVIIFQRFTRVAEFEQKFQWCLLNVPMQLITCSCVVITWNMH